MYACICSAVTVEQVEEAVDRGAHTVEAVGDRTRAGSCCGGCHDTIADVIEQRCGACPLAALAVA